jgi:antitoxin component YwqK of YwqJK toxin-antitoxin module
VSERDRSGRAARTARLRIYGASHRGETEGRWRSWHANGRVSVEASYRAGELVGPFQMWDEGGRLVYAGTHDANGEMDGTWTRWYANGNERIRWEMRHGVAHGSVAAWWEDGARKFAGRRAEGLRDGEWIWWSPRGDVVARCRYERNAVVDGICGSDDPPPR